MLARVLITTADERTWPKDKNEPVLFLGEWCLLYSRRHVWQGMDYEVVTYHWDDRKKLLLDYQYLQCLHEELLEDLSVQLNHMHDTDHTLHYWRILVGVWLGYFVQMLYDRWFMIKYAIESYNISKCYILDQNEYFSVPNDMEQFGKIFVGDSWNEVIYAQLLKAYWANNIRLKVINLSNKKPVYNLEKTSSKQYIKRAISNFVAKYHGILPKNDEFFLISTGFSLEVNLKIQLQLHQIPKLWHKQETPKSKINKERRKWSLLEDEKKEQFNLVARRFISQHLPVVYLEGYKSLVLLTQKLPWPVRPKLIYTSIAYSVDDVFKCWAAEKKPLLVINQHGGNFGTNTFSFEEDHQIKIADKWLSWGWSDPLGVKILPIGALSISSKNVKHNPKGGVLMVEMALPRYSYYLYSVPVSRQWLDYFNDQQRFISLLPRYLQNFFLVRLHPKDYGWDQFSRYNDAMPDIRIDDGQKKIVKLIEQCRIYISTYNATTFLEVLGWNIPVIIFWNPLHWELNEDAIPFFEVLESVGIFHKTPDSAAQKLIEVWDDVDAWWKSEEVQSAREEFSLKYVQIVNNPASKLVNILQNVANDNKISFVDK